jgi:hypothetical protein
MSICIDPTIRKGDHYPFEVEYHDGSPYRYEKGKPIYLWQAWGFDTKEEAQAFVKSRRYGRYFEK